MSIVSLVSPLTRFWASLLKAWNLPSADMLTNSQKYPSACPPTESTLTRPVTCASSALAPTRVLITTTATTRAADIIFEHMTDSPTREPTSERHRIGVTQGVGRDANRATG